MDRIVYLPLSPDMALDTASNMAEAVLQCSASPQRKGRRDPGVRDAFCAFRVGVRVRCKNKVPLLHVAFLEHTENVDPSLASKLIDNGELITF